MTKSIALLVGARPPLARSACLTQIANPVAWNIARRDTGSNLRVTLDERSLPNTAIEKDMNAYLYLVFAVLADTAGAAALEDADGFRAPLPSVLALMCYFGAFASLAFAVRTLRLEWATRCGQGPASSWWPWWVISSTGRRSIELRWPACCSYSWVRGLSISVLAAFPGDASNGGVTRIRGP